ncbi:hypothetical protein F5Y09DRAFT_131683 [Xylaria sp. FL1042]|nr:hypothetical protein F5Y09DRAFT_131683 [Xylaria sp. FL1042]
MAYAAEQENFMRCEVGLPPFYLRRYRDPYPYGRLGGYDTLFMRGWAACNHHHWAPDISSIKMPLGKLLRLTHRRKCTEERDTIMGVLGLALAVEQFRPNGISTLDDAYREAIRCGALGAEVLLADLGGTSPNSCWIPKSGNKHSTVPEEHCNALRPVVDSDGALICKAFEAEIGTIQDSRICLARLRMNGGTYDLMIETYMNQSGKAYILAAHDADSVAAYDPDSLENRIGVWATETSNGTHHIKGTARILRVCPAREHGRRSGIKKEDPVITLRFG